MAGRKFQVYVAEALREHAEKQVQSGLYKNYSDYISALIRRDMAAVEEGS